MPLCPYHINFTMDSSKFTSFTSFTSFLKPLSTKKPLPSKSKGNDSSKNLTFSYQYQAVFFTPYHIYTAAMLTLDSRFLLNTSFYFTFKCTQDFFSPFFGNILINYNKKIKILQRTGF